MVCVLPFLTQGTFARGWDTPTAEVVIGRKMFPSQLPNEHLDL
jgi:hypothetical protein